MVTAFTIGHSLTLALAASGLIHVPGRPIEVLVAVSILISAVHAVRPLFPGREAFIAGGFGLIHGLAFASTLAELGLYGWERVTSIFAFNLGIEAMQLLVVLCIMPSLILLSRTTVYTSFRWIGASFAGLAALGWIVERVTGWSLAVDRVVDGVCRYSTLSVSILFGASVLIYRWQRLSTSPEPGHKHRSLLNAGVLRTTATKTLGPLTPETLAEAHQIGESATRPRIRSFCLAYRAKPTTRTKLISILVTLFMTASSSFAQTQLEAIFSSPLVTNGPTTSSDGRLFTVVQPSKPGESPEVVEIRCRHKQGRANLRSRQRDAPLELCR